MGAHFEGKAGRKSKGLVNMEGADKLPGKELGAGVTRDDDAEEPLIVELSLAKQRGHSIDGADDIGGEHVIIVRCEDEQCVARLNGRVKALNDIVVVDAPGLFAHFFTYFIGTSAAVADVLISKGEEVVVDTLQMLSDLIPHGTGGGDTFSSNGPHGETRSLFFFVRGKEPFAGAFQLPGKDFLGRSTQGIA